MSIINFDPKKAKADNSGTGINFDPNKAHAGELLSVDFVDNSVNGLRNMSDNILKQNILKTQIPSKTYEGNMVAEKQQSLNKKIYLSSARTKKFNGEKLNAAEIGALIKNGEDVMAKPPENNSQAYNLRKDAFDDKWNHLEKTIINSDDYNEFSKKGYSLAKNITRTGNNNGKNFLEKFASDYNFKNSNDNIGINKSLYKQIINREGLYKYLTIQEESIYCYLAAKGDNKNINEYVNYFLKPKLESRKAADIASSNDKQGFWGGIKNTGNAASSGFSNSLTEMARAGIGMSFENGSVTNRDLLTILEPTYQEKLYSEISQRAYDKNYIYGIWLDIVNNTSAQIPEIIMGYAGGQGAYITSLAQKMIGSGTTEAIREGENATKGIIKGAIMTALEYAPDHLLGGMSGAKPALTSKLVDRVVNNTFANPKVSRLFAKAVTVVSSQLGEGLEEFFQEFAEPIVNNIVFGKNEKLYEETFTNALKSFIIGFFSTTVNAIRNSGSQIVNSHLDIVGSELKELAGVKGIIDLAEASENNSELYYQVKGFLNSGREVDNSTLANLYMESATKFAHTSPKAAEAYAKKNVDTLIKTALQYTQNKHSNPESELLITTNAISNPISSYPKEKQQVIKSFINSVDGKIKNFVENIKNGDLTFRREKISDVNTREASDIKKLLGIDVSGYTHNINTNSIKHILNRHGENGNHDNSMAVTEDIARIGWVLDNYDSVEVLSKNEETVKSSEFMDKKNNPAVQIKFEKKIDGTYYVVEAVFENNYKKLWIQSAYLKKSKEDVTQALNAIENDNLETTAKTALPSPSSDINIPQGAIDVNNNISKGAADYSENRQSEAAGLTLVEALKSEERHRVDKKEQDLIKKVAKALGLKVQFEHITREDIEKKKGKKLTGALPDGYYEEDTGVIHIGFAAESPLAFVFKHELTHFGEGTESYKKFVKAVKNSNAYKEWLLKKTHLEKGSVEVLEIAYENKLSQSYPKDTDFDAEMIADFVGDILFKDNASGLEKLLNSLDYKERNAVIRFLQDFINHIKKAFASGDEKLAIEISQLEDRFNRILSEALQTEKNSTDNVGGIKFSFARVVDADTILEAEQMETELKDKNKSEEEIRAEIWKKLGVIRDTGDVWVYEIDDSEFEFRPYGDAVNELTPELKEFYKLAEMGRRNADKEKRFKELKDKYGSSYFRKGKLKDFVIHDELFEKYPQLKETNFEFRNISSEAYYDANTDTIVLDVKKLLPKRGLKGLEKKIDEIARKIGFETEVIHEIQHAIQHYDERENGTNVKYWNARLLRGERLPINPETGEEFTPQEAYEATKGEYEARETEIRRTSDKKERREEVPDLGWGKTISAKEPALTSNAEYSVSDSGNANGQSRAPVPTKTNNNEVDRYSEEQYNNFGWASHNEVISATERETLLSRYADYKHNKDKYPTTRFGEAVLHSTECPDVIMYVKGDIGNPQITKVVRIVAETEVEATIIKEGVLANEYDKVPLPYEAIEDAFGTEVLDISKKRDFTPFQEYISRTEGRNSEESDTDSRTGENRGSGIEQNTKNDRAGLKRLAFSMPNDGRSRAPVPTEKNREYLSAVGNDDVQTAQRLVDEAAEANGYTQRLYHQTGADFTEFNTENQRAGKFDWELPTGTFLKPTSDDIGLKGKKQMELYAKFRNPIMLKDRKDAQRFWKENIEGYSEVANKIRKIDSEYRAKVDNAEADVQDYIKEWKKNNPDAKRSEVYSDSKFQSLYDKQQDITDEWEKANEKVSVEAKKLIDDYIRESDYDGIILERDDDGNNRYTKSYIAFNSAQLKDASAVTYDDNGNIISLSERFDGTKSDIRYSIPTKTNLVIDKYERGEISEEEKQTEVDLLWGEAIERYGTIKEGEKAKNPIVVPKAVDEKKLTKRFTRTFLEAGELTSEMIEDIEEQILLGGIYSYEALSDEKSQEYADKAMANGNAQSDWDAAVNSSIISKKEIAIGEKLLLEAIEKNDRLRVLELSAQLADVFTRAGQTVQASRMFKKMSGIGMLVTAQRNVKTLSKDLQEKYGDKFTVELDPKLAELIANIKNPDDIEIVYKEILRDVGSQVPTTFLDKLNAWRYFAMLANPKTHVRNLLGNTVFMPMKMIKDVLATTGERIFIKDINQRTKSLLIEKKYRKFVSEFVKSRDAKNDLIGDGMLDDKSIIKSGQRIFKTKWLDTLTKWNSKLLEAEDMLFKSFYYKNALAGFLQARKVDINNVSENVLTEARIYATNEAKKATYQDAAVLANLLNNIRVPKKFEGDTKAKIAVGVAKVAIEGELPFKRTPINIIKRGVEYSPLGLLERLSIGLYDVRKGNITVSEYCDGLAAGLTGTGLMAIGWFLASMGWVTGGFGDDEEDKFKKLNGEQEYSVNIFGRSYTIDWAAPACIPFFIGAELAEEISEADGLQFKDITETLWNTLEPITNLSMLSGVQGLIDAVRYEDESKTISTMASDIGLSFAMQLFPSAFSSLARTIDPKQRAWYIDKNSPLDSITQSAINNIQSKVPGLSYTQIPKIDVWGREVSRGEVGERIAENFISPGYYSRIDYSDADKELKRLFVKTGENVFPKKAEKDFEIDGKKKYLTAREYVTFAKAKGEYSFDYINEFISNPAYEFLSDDERAKVITELYSYANAKAKSTVSDYDPMEINLYKTVTKWERRGKSAVDYYISNAIDNR